MGGGHNEITGSPQLQAGIRIALGERGGLWSGLERLSESLEVSFNPWDLLEHALPRGEYVFAREVTSPAVVARLAAVEIINPAGSQILTVIKGLSQIATGTNIEFGIDVGPAIGANQVVRRGVPVDSRFNNLGATLGEVSRTQLVQSDVAAGISLRQYQLASGTQADPSMTRWVLAPGSKLFIISTVVNQAFSLALRFSERAITLVEQIGR